MIIKYQNRNRVFYWMYFILFFVGLVAVTGGMFLFENTVVSWNIPVMIFLLTGILMTPITSFSLGKYCKVESFFLKLFFNIVAFGGLLVGFLIAINFYFTNDKQQSYKTEIIEIGKIKSRGKLSNPYATVIINGTNKRLIFPYNFELVNYKFIEVDTKKGLLGFDIITNKRLIIE